MKFIKPNLRRLLKVLLLLFLDSTFLDIQSFPLELQPPPTTFWYSDISLQQGEPRKLAQQSKTAPDGHDNLTRKHTYKAASIIDYTNLDLFKDYTDLVKR